MRSHVRVEGGRSFNTIFILVPINAAKTGPEKVQLEEFRNNVSLSLSP